MSVQSFAMGDEAPSAQAIRQQLDKLCASGSLKLSERNRRFLAFVVNEALEGRGERIKAYTIGVDVFGRGSDFDPATDPIVRIEATRIRTALALYYDGPGASDPVHIMIPPGSYAPIFRISKAAPLPVAAPVPIASFASCTGPPHPSFFIAHRSDPADRCAASRGELLVCAVVRRLTASGCDVYMTSASSDGILKQLMDASRSAYAVEIAVHTLAGAKRYDWRLTDLWSRRVGWSEASDHADAGHPSAETIDGLACQIVDRVLCVAR
ncbi:hypothetical protein ACFQI3_11595 [Hansschlegelia quercus]|uniref:Uncharacterized protein n=1 Tax=Hansschlegelia quercus TaxID=2528245 RepID=A0A4Q9GKC8_9HYPH|nr:hypothetical protein [Hansschlegelia quercus]TBN53495.1 hypothetical protein EYR15_10840 [Hansschlegelia quercus]